MNRPGDGSPPPDGLIRRRARVGSDGQEPVDLRMKVGGFENRRRAGSAGADKRCRNLQPRILNVRIWQTASWTLARVPPFEPFVAGRIAERLLEEIFRYRVVFRADNCQVQRFGGEFIVREKRAGGGKAVNDRICSDEAHGAFRDLVVYWIRSDMEEQICGTGQGDVFVTLGMRRVG